MLLENLFLFSELFHKRNPKSKQQSQNPTAARAQGRGEQCKDWEGNKYRSTKMNETECLSIINYENNLTKWSRQSHRSFLLQNVHIYQRQCLKFNGRQATINLGNVHKCSHTTKIRNRGVGENEESQCHLYPSPSYTTLRVIIAAACFRTLPAPLPYYGKARVTIWFLMCFS